MVSQIQWRLRTLQRQQKMDAENNEIKRKRQKFLWVIITPTHIRVVKKWLAYGWPPEWCNVCVPVCVSSEHRSFVLCLSFTVIADRHLAIWIEKEDCTFSVYFRLCVMLFFLSMVVCVSWTKDTTPSTFDQTSQYPVFSGTFHFVVLSGFFVFGCLFVTWFVCNAWNKKWFACYGSHFALVDNDDLLSFYDLFVRSFFLFFFLLTFPNVSLSIHPSHFNTFAALTNGKRLKSV